MSINIESLEDAVKEINETYGLIKKANADTGEVPKALFKALWADSVWLVKVLRDHVPDLAQLMVVGKDVKPDVLQYLSELVERGGETSKDPLIGALVNSEELVVKAKVLLSRLINAERL